MDQGCKLEGREYRDVNTAVMSPGGFSATSTQNAACLIAAMHFGLLKLSEPGLLSCVIYLVW